MDSPARSPRYREFLDRLRSARADAGLTQEVVAQRLGKPQSFVSKCESGERRVDVVELGRFAEIYGKPVTYFLPTLAS
jgi:transcriptional regulator with XRE-family HTH domain